MADVILLIAVGFSMFGFVSTETYPCGTGTIYPERGTQVVVDCGVTTDHIAVFWYRDSTGSDPFLRLEGGRKTESAGFTIQDNGAMVITSADVTHDGLYVNRVIGNDGQSRDTNITVEVKVSLTSEPVIFDCSSSKHDVCTSVEEGKRQTTLACIAGPAKPPVSISWSSFDGTKQQSDYSSTQNGSTSLYTSTSLLEYNSKNYLLEYFTCSVSGEAVTETVTTGMFMKGNKDTVVQQQAINYVKRGADVTLECPLASGDTLGEWGIEFPNNTYRWLWRKYPGFDGGPCVDADDCDVQANGILHLSKVTYINEGHYLCTYASVVRKFPLEVLVSPEPQKTVIKGCEGKNDCELNVANSGSLECSIFGSRPSINPEVTVDKEVNPDDSSEVFIFGEELVSVVGSLPGTFDTVLRFEYTIPECSDVVRIECFAGDNTHSDEIMKTTVHLVTATSGCEQGGGRPGLIVFLIIFFLLIFIGIALLVYKRDYVLGKLGIRSRSEHDAVESADEVAPENAHVTQDRHEVEAIPIVTNVDVGTDETNRLQEIFNTKFQPIYLAITENKAKYEDFDKMMTSFSVEHKVNIPVPYLAGFLMGEKKSIEEVLKVLKFVMKHFNNQWVTYFLKMLDDLLETNQVTATNYITLIGNLVQKRVIELSRYVELTGVFLNNNTASFDIILSDLKNMIDKRYCSREDFSNTFLRYYLGNYITEDDVINELSAETESFKFLPPYLLKSVYQEMKEKNETKTMDKLSRIFKKVWDQLMGKSLELCIKLEPDVKSNKKDKLDKIAQLKTKETEQTNKHTPDSDVPLPETQKTENQELLPVTDDDKEKLKEKENQKAISTPEDEKEKVNENELSPLLNSSERESLKTETIPANKEEKLSETGNLKTETFPDIKKDKLIEELQSPLIRALLFAVDSKKINSSECTEMIKDTKVPEKDLGKFLDSYIRNTLATTKIAFGLLEKTLKEKMIGDEAYFNLYWLFVIPKKEVTFDDFMKHIKKLLEDKLISERCFEKRVTEFIKGDGAKQKKKKKSEEINVFSNYWDGNQWIKFVASLLIQRRPGYEKVPFEGKEVVLTDDMIGNSLRMTLFQCVVSTYKMKENDVKKALKDEYAIKSNERKPLLESVKFK